ncbi:MAG: hypothetical protein IPG21_03900 [Saprospiraceae bacterium]|nr:hypothetical protein [Candidatus Vicinibacter affinis]
MTNEDREEIKIYFSEARICYDRNAGHWIYSDQPVKMVEASKNILSEVSSFALLIKVNN